MTGGVISEYTYCVDGLRDRLQSFNGEKCEYDDLGNPTMYRGKTMLWGHVRNLKSINGSVHFNYNASGIRTTKTANDVETKYFYLDNRLLAEKRLLRTGDLSLGDNVYDSEIYYTYTDKTDISYMYNANELTSFTIARNGTHQTYYYRKNLMGDITHIYDSLGNLKAEYSYDAWGNHTVVTNLDNIANINPFRYRGYYYDVETGLYYLQSRYYDPQTGRFINADAISILDESKEHVNGLNLFAYCFNNPVMLTDETGEWPKWLKGLFMLLAAVVVVTVITVITVATGGSALPVIFGAVVGAGVSGGISAGVQLATTGTIDWGQLFIDMAVGTVMGGFGGSAVGLLGMTAAGAVTGFASSAASDWVDGKKVNWGKATVMGLIGGLISFAGGVGAQKGLTGATKSIQGTLKNLSSRSGRGIAGLTKIFSNRLAGAMNTLNRVAINSIVRSTIQSFEFEFYKEFLLNRIF